MFTGAFRGYRAIPVRSQSSFSAILLRLKELSFLFFFLLKFRFDSQRFFRNSMDFSRPSELLWIPEQLPSNFSAILANSRVSFCVLK